MAENPSQVAARRGTGKRTTRPYYWLYRALERNLERMKDEEGSFYEALQALITAAFLVESYLNTAGERLFPDWDTKPERGKSKAFHSIPEKLKFLVGEIERRAGVADVVLDERIVPGSDPRYVSLCRVVDFRTALAHSKAETTSGEWYSPPDSIEMHGLETEWERLLEDRILVRKMCNDCVSLVTALHRMRIQIGCVDVEKEPRPFFSGASSSGRSGA
jgi:hypothetical protein